MSGVCCEVDLVTDCPLKTNSALQSPWSHNKSEDDTEDQDEEDAQDSDEGEAEPEDDNFEEDEEGDYNAEQVNPRITSEM